MTGVSPLCEDLTVISSGNEPPLPQGIPPKWRVRGIKNNIGNVHLSTFGCMKDDGKLAVDVLKEKPNATIGWVEPSFLPMTFAAYLEENLPEAPFVDATKSVDLLRAHKSDGRSARTMRAGYCWAKMEIIGLEEIIKVEAKQCELGCPAEEHESGHTAVFLASDESGANHPPDHHRQLRHACVGLRTEGRGRRSGLVKAVILIERPPETQG